MSRSARALIFDLDGTLVDTVYAHVFAWQRALPRLGLPVDGWRIHRRIGMSGGLFARAAAREIGRQPDDDETETIQRRHGEIFREILPERRPFPERSSCWPTSGGAGSCTASRHPDGGPRSMHRWRRWASGGKRSSSNVATCCVPSPSRTSSSTCQERLGVAISDCYVVGDAVWDLLAARRAGMLSVGLFTGGYGEDELRAPAHSASIVTLRSCRNHSMSSEYGSESLRLLGEAAAGI